MAGRPIAFSSQPPLAAYNQQYPDTNLGRSKLQIAGLNDLIKKVNEYTTDLTANSKAGIEIGCNAQIWDMPSVYFVFNSSLSFLDCVWLG